MNSYLVKTPYEDTIKYAKEYPKFDKDKINPNIVAISNSGAIVWFEVKPPSRECKVFIQSKGEVLVVDVVDVFKVIQTECKAWSEV